jgi:hypothetical protein
MKIVGGINGGNLLNGRAASNNAKMLSTSPRVFDFASTLEFPLKVTLRL